MQKSILHPIHILSLLLATGCTKTIRIDPPIGDITSSQVFSTDEQATSAAAGMYYNLINAGSSFAYFGLSPYGGFSADELIPFDQTISENVQFFDDSLLPTNGTLTTTLWQNAFSVNYSANAIIQGLANNSGVHDSIRTELTGEAEFIRAFVNFYLINLFGDIPLVTTINWENTALLPRSSVLSVYSQIISDLKSAKSLLAKDYSVGQGQRIIPNRWAAAALLARVYLYTKDWTNARTEADSILANTALFGLCPDLRQVFLANSREAIWQLQQNNEGFTYNATPDGYLFIPGQINSDFAPPFATITDYLLHSFDSADQRKAIWVDSTLFAGTEYYFPYKYQVGPGEAVAGGPDAEYCTVLRLAEVYLIRAEAEANLNDLSDAVLDINSIRNRAGLGGTNAATQPEVLSAIAHERQTEFFCEWGHRWLDVKRTGDASAALSITKARAVSNNALLYPIPQLELQIDPNLVQNPGY